MVGMWASVCCLVEKTERKDAMYILPIVYVSMTTRLKASTQQIGHQMALQAPRPTGGQSPQMFLCAF